jgi:hypothetical protein
LLSSAFARAKEPDSNARRAALELYTQASREMKAGDYARACPRLEAARKILPQHVRTGMTLAQCYDQAGQPASARAELLRVKPLADAQGDADKASEIKSRLASLEGRVSRLTIEVPAGISALPGLVISRNGAPIETVQWGRAEPVDPGAYEIAATALGKEPWSTRVELREHGQTIRVTVAPPWALPAAVVDRPVEEKRASLPPAGEVSPWMRTAGFVGIGLGAAGIGVGAVLGGAAISRKNASNDGHCNAQDHCDRVGFDLRSEAVALGQGSTAALVVGGAILATGVVLVAISHVGSKGQEVVKRRARASLVVGGSGVWAEGVW